MTMAAPALRIVMEQAVTACIAHVESGGLPFVGVVVNDTGVISTFGVNEVHETGDPHAHAEIVAMRNAMSAGDLQDLAGTTLLATGEPCGLCYRFAIAHKVDGVHVAVDRDEVAALGFDYRASYRALGISEQQRAGLLHHLPVERRTEPFARFLQSTTSP